MTDASVPIIDLALIAAFIALTGLIVFLNWYTTRPPSDTDRACSRIDESLARDELRARRQLRDQARTGNVNNVVPLPTRRDGGGWIA